MENLTIGITGGIGTGKSVVSRVLRCNGFEVYDCDTSAKKLMENDIHLKEKLRSELGGEIYHNNGSLNKKLLASKLFNDDNVRNFVNSLVHEAVRKEISSLRIKIKGKFFIESAILFTSHLAEDCDKIWLVEAPLEERIKRVEKRDSMNRKEIEKRINSQRLEFSQIDSEKTLVIINDDYKPMLPIILQQIDKNQNNQIFTVLC